MHVISSSPGRLGWSDQVQICLFVIRAAWSSQCDSQCLTATIKTPNQDSGRLCRTTTELFIIPTACTVAFPHVFSATVEYVRSGSTQQGDFVSSFFLASFNRHPPTMVLPLLAFFFHLSLASLSLCFCLEVEPIDHHPPPSDSSLKKARLVVMQSRRRSTGMWHVSSNAGSERRSAAFCMQAGLA